MTLPPWKKSYNQPGQHIKKQRHYFTNKFLSSQSFGFSSTRVWMWVLYYKDSWATKNWCFWTVVLDLLAVQRTLKSLLQNHSSKASVLQCSAFFTVQLSHPYVTTGKTIALTRQTFVSKVMSLLFNMWSTLVIAFLPRSRCLLISWLQSPSAVILEPSK